MNGRRLRQLFLCCKKRKSFDGGHDTLKHWSTVESTPVIQHGDSQRAALEEWITFSHGKIYGQIVTKKRSSLQWGIKDLEMAASLCDRCHFSMNLYYLV